MNIYLAMLVKAIDLINSYVSNKGSIWYLNLIINHYVCNNEIEI